MTRAEIVNDSIKNECPNCGAMPGEACKDNHGREITHGERLHGVTPRQERKHHSRTPYASSYIPA